jgi:hypothetical protein
MQSPVSLSLRELERVEQLQQRVSLAADTAARGGDAAVAAYAAGVLDTLTWLAHGKPSTHLIDLTLEH